MVNKIQNFVMVASDLGAAGLNYLVFVIPWSIITFVI